VFGDGGYKLKIENSDGVLQDTLDNLIFVYPDNDTIYAGTSTGSSNNYAVAPSPALTALTDGVTITFVANHASTSTATLNPSGLGSYAFVKSDGTTNLTTGDIVINQVVDAKYIASSNHFRLVSEAGVQPISAGGTGASTVAGAKANLSIGTIAEQNANSVAITGGTIAGITSLTATGGSVTGLTNLTTASATISGGTATLSSATIGGGTASLSSAIVSGTLELTSAPSYPNAFGFATVRTIDPAAGTNAFEQTVGNFLCTLAADLRALKILKP
jgi:hypothetical protein